MSATTTTGYLVKEIFGPTIQGEGAHAGRACVFLRFAVCNLACAWCDTDFDRVGATRMTADDIRQALIAVDKNASRMVVVTGGEPTLQWNTALATAIKDAGFAIHMETNGTRPLAAEVDWLTVSPKPQFHTKESLLGPAELAASECKVVVDRTVDSATLAGFESRYQCDRWFLQPCMDDSYEDHLARTLELIATHPRWQLSLQLHKILGLP